MAVTQQDIDALNAAIASGERQVVIGGESVTYNTTDSLIRARNDLTAQLNAATARTEGRRRPKQTVLVYQGRGY